MEGLGGGFGRSDGDGEGGDGGDEVVERVVEGHCSW